MRSVRPIATIATGTTGRLFPTRNPRIAPAAIPTPAGPGQQSRGTIGRHRAVAMNAMKAAGHQVRIRRTQTAPTAIPIRGKSGTTKQSGIDDAELSRLSKL